MTRQEAIERIKNDIELNHNCLANEYITALNMAIEALEQEGIIRCGDCKHYREYEPDADYDGWCSLDRVTDVNKEDFCSRAERREE